MEKILYVSVTGSGKMDGSGKENALAGIRQAVDAARNLEKPVTLQLLSGEYILQEPLVLDERDSFTSFVGENATISGGWHILKWDTEGNGILSAKVPAGAKPTRLYVNGKTTKRARFPEAGYFPTRNTPVNPAGWANVYLQDLEDIEKRLLHFEPEMIPFALEDPEGTEFVILQYWMEARLYPERYDPRDGEVLFRAGSWNPLSWSFGCFLENVKEGLSEPGSWYFSGKESRVYYHLRDGETAETVDAVCPMLQQLITCAPAKKAEQICFRGIRFADTNATPFGVSHHTPQAELQAPVSLHFCNADRVSFEDCTFENLGGYALWLAKGCNACRVEYCRFLHCAAGAVRIGEEKRPADKSEFCDGHVFRNNRIENCGEHYLGSAGIWIGQSGHNILAHNDISGPLQWAISVGWNWAYFPLNRSCSNRITDNFIHELGTGELGTHGAIYILGVAPDTLIEGNYIRNVYATKHWGAGEGIILDNGCAGITIQNNIITKAVAGGWGCNFNCFGNIIRNNIFCFGRKYQLTRYGDPPDSDKEPANGEIFTQNIVLWEEGPLFPAKWPSFRTLWDYNLYWNTAGSVEFTGMDLAQWQALGLDEHSVVADPMFRDANHEDFTLPEDSPALRIGFEPFSLDQVGILPR